MGVDLRFIWGDKGTQKIFNCDAIWINSKVYRSWWKDRKNELLERFDCFNSTVKSVIYFDTTDSSGTLQHELFPYVSKYCKPYLLKDRSLYLKTFYGGRIFTDYYHKKFNVNDSVEISDQLKGGIVEKYLSKLEMSWSHVLVQDRKQLFNTYVLPQKRRSIDVSGRFGVGNKRETVNYQREMIKAILLELNFATEKINRYRYYQELRMSKIGVAPFGAGEFNYRDFEIIIRGALLYKPNMVHIETWPNIYSKNETYVPFKWDLTDFKEKIYSTLNNSEKRIEIANNAQEILREFRESDQVREEFCDKVANMASSF
tara:strand:+ start:4668 stop:5612 length:945 start_codon:yes stop_codon:yes gene_type:complete